MHFLDCEDCRETVRVAAFDPTAGGPGDALAEAFRERHRGCRLRSWRPTGEATASLPWHDPLAIRRIEVRSEERVAVAVGSRRRLDEPLVWRLEPAASSPAGDAESESSVEIDRELFWRVVERALHPLHLPRRLLEAWAVQIERFTRSVLPQDIVLLEDDPHAGNATFARFTLTARARLEGALTGLGFDAATAERLERLFDDETFPPLRVLRRIAPQAGASAAPSRSDLALTR